MCASFLAFLSGIGGGEFVILVVIGLLLFGRDLPAVGKKLGHTVSQFRRGLHDFKEQMERDADLREMKQTVEELKRAAQLPHSVADAPNRFLRDLTDEALASPGAAPVPEPPAAAPPPAPPAKDGTPPTSSAESGPTAS